MTGQRKLNGLALAVRACAKPSARATPEQMRELLEQCVPYLRAASATPQPVPPATLAQQKDAVLQASIDFIESLTGLTPPDIEVAPPEVFAPFKTFADKVCEIFAGNPVAQPVPPATKCKKCAGQMKHGQAIAQTFSSGLPDFPGDAHGMTISPGGPGKLIDCLKCEDCGWSVTSTPSESKV